MSLYSKLDDKAYREEIYDILTPHWTPIREATAYGPTGARALAWHVMTEDLAKTLLLPCGRRSLKSLLCRRAMVMKLQQPGSRYFIGAPTRQQVKRIHWNSVQKLIPPSWIERVYKTDLCIVTHWGAELWLVGLDAPERIEGDTEGWDGCLIDESADIRDPETIPAHIEPAMQTRDGFIWRIGVPDYKGPSNADYEDAWNKATKWDASDITRDDGGRRLRAALRVAREQGERVESVGISWASEDVMPVKDVSYFKRKLSKLIYLQELRASFVTAPGRAYNEYSEGLHKKPTPFLRGTPIQISCDFNYGFHNWIMSQVVYPKELSGMPLFRIPDQIFLQDSNVAKMIAELVRKLRHYDPTIITKVEQKKDDSGSHTVYHTKAQTLSFYGDYSGEQKHAEATLSAWRQIKKAFPQGLFRYRFNGPIADRIDATNGALCSADETVRIRIDPKAEELHNDLKFVTRKLLLGDSKTLRLSHSSDCLGYLVVQYRGGKIDPKRIAATKSRL